MNSSNGKKSLVSAKTISLMANDWKKYYIPQKEFLSKSIYDVSKLDIDKVHDYILENYTRCVKGEGWVKMAPTSRAFNNIKGVVKQMFDYASDDADYLEKNPYRVKINKKKVQPNRKKENVDTIFLPSEEDALIVNLKKQGQENPTDTSSFAIRLCFETGLRVGELLALCENDIISRNGNTYIQIQRQQVEITDVTDINNIKFNAGFKVVDYAKSDTYIRSVPLSTAALLIIDRVMQINSKHHKQHDDYLFLKDGNVMPPTEVEKTMRRACRGCKISIKHIHSVRKTYASKLYSNGVDVPTISKLLGHADEETTRRRYIFSTKSNDENFDAVMKALEKQKVTKSNQNIIPIERVPMPGTQEKWDKLVFISFPTSLKREA